MKAQVLTFKRGAILSDINSVAEVTDDISADDSAADYTDRMGRHLSLSERMQERSLRDQRNT